MSKAETIDALVESAIHCFSRDGYEGASLRDIARYANVPLSTIHFYFGSKPELFAAVARQAWIEIDEERSSYLAAALAANPQKPCLKALMHALAYPIVRRALSKSERDLGQIYILRSHTSSSKPTSADKMLELADRSIKRWIDAIERLHPALSRSEVIWTFSFAIGAIYSWQVIDHRYDSMLGAEGERTVEDVTRDMVDFCASGIEAIVARRMAATRTTAIA